LIVSAVAITHCVIATVSRQRLIATVSWRRPTKTTSAPWMARTPTGSVPSRWSEALEAAGFVPVAVTHSFAPRRAASMSALPARHNQSER
jgi:hypothetical protein